MKTEQHDFAEFKQLLAIVVAAAMLCITIVVSRAMM